MVPKMSFALLFLIGTALVIQTGEAVLFTLGGAAIDTAIAFFVFEKLLLVPLLVLGKRSVDNPNPLKTPTASRFGSQASPQEYLAVVAAMDVEKCLPVAICASMAKSKDSNANKTKFENKVIDSFQRKINESNDENVTPFNIYIKAAKFGQAVGEIERCREISPSCNFTVSELSQLQVNVFQYQL